MQNDPAWQAVVDAPEGYILADWYEEDIRCLVMKGPGNLCGYVGLPITHPLAGFESEDMPLNCHGGLNFSSPGSGDYPEGWHWYGWDYGHTGDYKTYYDESPSLWMAGFHKWTVEVVKEEVKAVAAQLATFRLGHKLVRVVIKPEEEKE